MACFYRHRYININKMEPLVATKYNNANSSFINIKNKLRR